MANVDVYGADMPDYSNPSAYNPQDAMRNYAGGSAGFQEATPQAPSAPSGQNYLTPGYQMPAPGTAANLGIPNVPRPSVNPSVVYTDQQGNGYDAPALAAAMKNPGFSGNPLNARVGDILTQYGYGAPQQATPAAGSGSPSGYSGTSIFSDPATSQYEQLLNGIIGKLNTPYQAPDFQPTLDAIKDYVTRLNGPAYTPDQMALMQTQAFDPIMAARDQQEQQIIARFAQQGMGPSSGPVQAAILANRQYYDKLGTTSRANVATSAIGQQNQNQANAIGLQAQLPTLETNANTYNNQNSLQAANLAGIVPQMAWNRLQGANQGLSQNNPMQALSLLNAFQQQGQNNGAAYSQQLMQILPYLLQAFGVH